MASLPSYVAAAKPVPLGNRAPWYLTTAQTYAGIMLWFVFWENVPAAGEGAGRTLAQGLVVAFAGLVLAALLCHFLYYLVPGLLGLKTGLPLYIVGTSTYGVVGGFIMPGFLMGLLQFGWLGVNVFASAKLLCAPFYESPDATLGTAPHVIVSIIWAVAAAFMALKGIHYVARVATFLPLIPLVILVILAAATIGGVGKFTPDMAFTRDAAAVGPMDSWEVIAILLTMIIGFFATAGAAGCDFGMNNRNEKDVHLGGLVGIAGATIFAGGLALLIVAGALGLGKTIEPFSMQATAWMSAIMGKNIAALFWWLLAIAAFPPACFSAFIAANSFKTTLPNVNPFISVGIGTAVSIILAITGWAGKVVDVFVVIGASFGPICGAMAADYLLAGRRWAGPRAGFNPAGWISWVFGFFVGAADLLAKYIPALAALKGVIPVPPLSAFIVGFVLYVALAKLGLESKALPKPGETR